MQGAHLHLKYPALKQVVQPNIAEGNQTRHLMLKEGVFVIVDAVRELPRGVGGGLEAMLAQINRPG